MIHVVKDGRLVESGTYQDLKDREGALSEVLETFQSKQVDTHTDPITGFLLLLVIWYFVRVIPMLHWWETPQANAITHDDDSYDDSSDNDDDEEEDSK